MSLAVLNFFHSKFSALTTCDFIVSLDGCYRFNGSHPYLARNECTDGKYIQRCLFFHDQFLYVML